jgi:hypothetical protein
MKFNANFMAFFRHQKIYKQIFFIPFMKRSSRRWKKKRQMRWKWQRKKLRKAKHLRKVRRDRSK